MDQKNTRRLGRGLSSLISLPDESPVKPEAAHDARPAAAILIDIAQVGLNPFQPRQDIAPQQLTSLAESIRKHGLMQPIIVRPTSGGAYQLIAGERRWRAAQMAGLTEISAVVRQASDAEMLEMALVENIFREDLNPIDRAAAYRRYCDQFQLTAEEVASRVGEDRSTVTNYLRLLELPGEVRQLVASGGLGMGHARALLGIRNPSDLARLAARIVEEGLSVRKVEKLVREHSATRSAASRQTPTAKRPQIRNMEESFVRAVGSKVEIQESRRKGAGKIVIHYQNLDDFDRIAQRLGVNPPP